MKIVVLLLLSFNLYAQTNSPFLDSLLSRDEFLEQIISNKDKYQIQILYTQINRDKDNKPSFTSFRCNVDTMRYFYPASSIKLPAAVLALQKLNELRIDKLKKETFLRIDSSYAGQTAVIRDSSAERGRPSISQFIKKLFLVSDNDAFNRLYEFAGQKYLNQQLWKRGYRSVRFLHRLSAPLSLEENRHTNAFTFYKQGNIVYHQPPEFNPFEYRNHYKDVLKGKGYIRNDSLINKPKDFSNNNAVSLEDLQGILRTVMFPESKPEDQSFELTDEDYLFLYRCMSMLPRESKYPSYDTLEYKDNYVKFLIYGDQNTRIPKNVRIFNKIGMAYGYLIDNAYIIDFEKNIEFLLTAVIYVNKDEIFNDDKYEYDTIGLPFMGKLGRVIYEYEKSRVRENVPRLSKYKFLY